MVIGQRIKAYRIARKVVRENPGLTEEEYLTKATEVIKSDLELMELVNSDDDKKALDFQKIIEMIMAFIKMFMLLFG